jgi:hypothetical protein
VRKLLGMLAASIMLVALPARASVLLDTNLSGTGDNVIADTVGTTSAVGHLNGQHIDVVDYTGLTAGFTGAASGNDIKIDNTVGIIIDVKDPTNTFEIGTLTQVFSLKGTGDVHLSVTTNDGTFFFDLGMIDPNAQSGFTLTAINGELMTTLALLDVGGTITDFEHNRIDVGANLAATPLPGAVWLFASGLGGLMMLGGRRRRKAAIA